MKLHELIQKRRKDLQVTQREIAEKLNISDKTISRWENGTSYPDYEMIPKLAKVLELQVSDLFEENMSVELNEEKIDYTNMSMYRIGMIYSCASLVFSLVVFPFSSLAESNLAYLVIVGFSGLLCASSIFSFIVMNVYFTSQYKNKFYQDVYVDYQIGYQIRYVYLFIVCIETFMLLFLTINIYKIILFAPFIVGFIFFYYIKQKQRMIPWKKSNIITLSVSIILLCFAFLFSFVWELNMYPKMLVFLFGLFIPYSFLISKFLKSFQKI